MQPRPWLYKDWIFACCRTVYDKKTLVRNNFTDFFNWIRYLMSCRYVASAANLYSICTLVPYSGNHWRNIRPTPASISVLDIQPHASHLRKMVPLFRRALLPYDTLVLIGDESHVHTDWWLKCEHVLVNPEHIFLEHRLMIWMRLLLNIVQTRKISW